MKKKIATLLDGRTLEYMESDDPPSGAMKKTYFAPDKSYVVQFFLDQSSNDAQRMARLKAIIGRYNPTLSEQAGGARGTSNESAEYFKNLFCWPTDIVVKPEFGIVAPTYPGDFFFSSGNWKGQEKEGRWFSSPKLRKMIPEGERGNFMTYLSICIQMARSIRRLHQAGLAHSDLSSKNILIDPVSGRSNIIDIDSLVVPGVFPPDVLGSPGYIAPEVISTQHLPLNDPNRNNPSIRTDLHALAVLFYEYLLHRHPLRGPRVNSVVSAEEDEILSMGKNALFIEHPTDTSNRPNDITIPQTVLGPYISTQFEKTFVEGLHSPYDRATAAEWEKALNQTWELLYPCTNHQCEQKWFILHDSSNPVCPFCGTKATHDIPILRFRKQSRPGVWVNEGTQVVYNGTYLFKWNAFDNVYPGELADRSPQAYCVYHENRWILVNQKLDSLTSPDGNRVPLNSAIELKDGSRFKLSQEEHGKIVEVHYSKARAFA